MRDSIVVIAIFSLIIGGSIWIYKFYENTKSVFEDKLETLVETIETEEKKEIRIKEIEDIWKEKESVLIIFQEHDSVDEIEDKLYECFHYYRINEADHLELSKEGMLKRLDDFIKGENLSIVNIF